MNRQVDDEAPRGESPTVAASARASGLRPRGRAAVAPTGNGRGDCAGGARGGGR
jgi:hypothetical protein